MYGETRWNSIYDTLCRLTELKDFCLKFQEDPDFRILKISNRQWDQIIELRDVLKLPAELTIKLQSENLLVSDFVYHWHSTMFALSMQTSSLSRSLMKCLKSREEEVFSNKVILAGWYLDKNLSVMNEMKSNNYKKQEAKTVFNQKSFL